VEEQRVQVLVGVAPASLRGLSLGDQYRASVRITIAHAPSVVRVPVSALVRDGQSWYVWTVEGGHTRRRDVRVGLRNAEYAEIRDGLDERAMVVRYPGETIHDGGRVRVPSS
jgi:HlyD family secretion protein